MHRYASSMKGSNLETNIAYCCHDCFVESSETILPTCCAHADATYYLRPRSGVARTVDGEDAPRTLVIECSIDLTDATQRHALAMRPPCRQPTKPNSALMTPDSAFQPTHATPTVATTHTFPLTTKNAEMSERRRTFLQILELDRPRQRLVRAIAQDVRPERRAGLERDREVFVSHVWWQSRDV